jgi:hypothetical protein
MSELAGLGRLIERDDRSAQFKLPRTTAPSTVRRKMWYAAPVLDQLSTPHCVGFTGFSWLQAGPIVNKKLAFTPGDVYKWAQDRDEWSGTNYDGTSGLGLMKALLEKGYITEYRWAYDIETIFNWLLTSGPLCFGSYWHRDMFTPGDDGFIVVGGPEDGGHEYLLCGADRDRKCPDGTTGAVRMQNSWGKGWGQKGRAWISKKDLETLLKNEGDCCTGTEVKLK